VEHVRPATRPRLSSKSRNSPRSPTGLRPELTARQERLASWALGRWKVDTAPAEGGPLQDTEPVVDIAEDAAEDTDPMPVTDIEDA
jgi:hypothetical protein